MSDPASTTAARLADFEYRKQVGCEVLEFRASEYIPVNPFSDEDALLEKIEARPADCIKVDAYWRVAGDVIFLQVLTPAAGSQLSVGRYKRWRDGERGGVNIFVIVSETSITRGTFEEVISNLLDEGIVASALQEGERLGSRLVSV